MKFDVASASAVEALVSNPLRSLLTMLGIIIGVASVMIMMSIGEGARAQIDAQIASVGSQVLSVMPGSANRGGISFGGGSGRPFAESDVAALEDLAVVEAATGTLQGQATAVSGENNWSTQIQGVGAGYFTVQNWEAAEGRTLTDAELGSSAALAVLGKTVAANLFPDGSAVGERIRVNGVPMQVVGVLAGKGQAGMGPDRDDVVIAPLSLVRSRIVGGSRLVNRHVTRIELLIRDGEDMAAAQAEVEETLRPRRRIGPGDADNFRIFNFADIIRQRGETANTMSLLLAFTAAVSLIVGGVGVMNIMLVSVTERTREIGLRMAIGARGGDILLQFLVEAVSLCAIGGLIGMAIGAAGAFAASEVGNWPFSLSPAIIGTAIGAAAFVGLIFGFFPARRAARLDPIQALRHD
jgi:putative ABC transport system permease protein